MKFFDDSNSDVNIHYIDVLDGLRALAIVIYGSTYGNRHG